MTERAIDEPDPPEETHLADVLSEFTRTMPPDSSIQAILDHLVQRIIGILPVSAAGATIASSNHDLAYVAASDAAALGYERLQKDLDEGPWVLASASGEAVAVPDLTDDGRFPAFGPRAVGSGLGAMFTFPLRHADHRLGSLNLYRGESGPLTPMAMTAAQTVADVVTAHLINAQAREELESAFEQLEQTTLHNTLTGLPNRALMLDRLELALLRSYRTGRSSAVMWIDLDLFEPAGEGQRSSAGSESLVAVALRLRGLLRRTDTLAQLTDDTFAILCEDLSARLQADAIAARLADALTLPFHLADAVHRMTASIGVAWVDPGQPGAERRHSPEQLLRDAYRARQQASSSDGDRKARRRRPLDLADIADDLVHAQARGEFHVEYQPILATASNRVTGFEALLRWIHPTEGSIPPATFIPLAEKSGLINQIGAWVLLQACADLRRWQAVQPIPEQRRSTERGAHQSDSGSPGVERAGAERAGAERAGAERAGAERAGAEPATVEKSGLEQSGIERPRAERPGMAAHRAGTPGTDLPGAEITMAVNVSVQQLMSPGFTASVAAVLAGTAARLLTLEITESIFIRDSRRALVVLDELRKLGVRLALDDFGTGYSSLSYLKTFPVDVLKIDRTFIADLVLDAASRSIVVAIVNLAHDLGMTVVAEGVETAEQLRAVGELGCDFYQGFYFAGAAPAPGYRSPGERPTVPQPAFGIPTQDRSRVAGGPPLVTVDLLETGRFDDG